MSIQVVERLRGVLPVVIDGEDWEEPAEELDGGLKYCILLKPLDLASLVM